MRKHCINWHFFKFLNQIWPKGTLIVALHARQVLELRAGTGELLQSGEVVLSCWIPMAQWGSFKAQQKLHFKAVFHAVH